MNGPTKYAIGQARRNLITAAHYAQLSPDAVRRLWMTMEDLIEREADRRAIVRLQVHVDELRNAPSATDDRLRFIVATEGGEA